MAAPTRGPARPHVGRSAELGRLLTAVTATDGRGAILAGPAGVGKSHLLDRAVDQLVGLGWSPLRAHGDPARRQPFDAFGDMLPPLAGDPDRWAHVLRTGVGHLVASAGPGRPVLVADDLHAFDLASAALLQQAVVDGRLRLLATLRTGEPAPDAVTALWKDDVVERVELRPLTVDEATELADQLNSSGLFEATTEDAAWEEYQTITKEGAYDLFILGWYPDFLDPDNYLSPFVRDGGFFANNYSNEEVNKLLDQEIGETDETARNEQISQLQDIVAEDVPLIPSWNGQNVAVANSSMQGVLDTLDPTYIFRFWMISKEG